MENHIQRSTTAVICNPVFVRLCYFMQLIFFIDNMVLLPKQNELILTLIARILILYVTRIILLALIRAMVGNYTV